ncbi:hypothetical protein [Hymenobacter siberiensis]|uniref:hypothetical protein n=1 Tax=Hymenobacter siberiensis TaxID=2848396 RepID=UPI001C1E6BB7|nr:hypothetical protein [Hymenobacter siberiensis]
MVSIHNIFDRFSHKEGKYHIVLYGEEKKITVPIACGNDITESLDSQLTYIRTDYADEFWSEEEVASVKLCVGRVLNGIGIRMYVSATPFWSSDKRTQRPARNSKSSHPYYKGVVIKLEDDQESPLDFTIATPETEPELYVFRSQNLKLIGIAAANKIGELNIR